MRTENVAPRAYEAICSCGWRSRFYETRDPAKVAWGVHRGRRQGDPAGLV